VTDRQLPTETTAPDAHPADGLLRPPLETALGDPEALELAFREPDRDLFDLGLDSLRAFTVLDTLAGEGVHVDFLDFTSAPTVTFLREAAERAG